MELVKRVNKAGLNTIDLAEPLTKLFAIVLGNLLCALAFNGFLIPNKLLSGGVGGTAIMVHYLTDMPTGWLVFIMNVPIFIIGAKMIDKKFAIYSFISMLVLSLLLSFTEGIYQYINVNDLLLSTIFGGLLNGLGMGIMFRNKVSQGGLDIIAAIFKRKLNMNIGTALMGVNGIIISLSSILFGLQPAMYTIIGLYIAYQIVDKVQQGIDTSKSVIIISDKPLDIANSIMENLNRGATFLNGEGAYSKSDKKIIYCMVTSTQIVKLKEIVEKVDEKAFITINDTEEVKGRGFKSIGI